jgi:hypothetical protein
MSKRTGRVFSLVLLVLLVLAAWWMDEKHPLQVRVIRNQTSVGSRFIADAGRS